jgi:hypothetical protein
MTHHMLCRKYAKLSPLYRPERCRRRPVRCRHWSVTTDNRHKDNRHTDNRQQTTDTQTHRHTDTQTTAKQKQGGESKVRATQRDADGSRHALRGSADIKDI